MLNRTVRALLNDWSATLISNKNMSRGLGQDLVLSCQIKALPLMSKNDVVPRVIQSYAAAIQTNDA